MADLRIVDAPEIPTENITGEEKLPTGGSGNYSISLDSLADYTKNKKDLVDNTTVDSKVGGVRQGLNTHIEDLLNPHQVTKGQIGLGNVDNTADADKPVSNSTQAAIISAVSPKADKTYVDTALSSKTDKTYVDNQLTLKANKADVYTKSETYTKQESSDLVNNSISTALIPVNSSLDLAKRGVVNRYDSSLTYNSGERVVLTNGDIVKSVVNGNTNDPNVNMTGWVNPVANYYSKPEIDTKLELKANLADVYLKNETFTKAEIDSLVEPKADTSYVDTALSNLSTVASKFYPTLTEANADIANLAVNQVVNVGEVSNGGLWYKATAGAITLTKSPYDPVRQSKEYTDSKISGQDILKQAQLTTDFFINIFPNENKIQSYAGFSNVSTLIIKCKPDTEYLIKNFTENPNAFSIHEYSQYTTALGTVLTPSAYSRIDSDTHKLKTGINTHYLYINKTINEFVNNISEIYEEVVSLDGIPLIAERDLLSEYINEQYYGENIYNESQVVTGKVIVTSSGNIIDFQTYRLAVVPVEAGSLLNIYCGDYRSNAFAFGFRNTNDLSTGETFGSGNSSSITLKDDNSFDVVVPTGMNYLFINVNYFGDPPVWDIRTTLRVSKYMEGKLYLTSINKLPLLDKKARELINNLESKLPLQLFEKRWLAIGDSLTDYTFRPYSTYKNYVEQLSGKFNMSVYNYGQSGSGFYGRYNSLNQITQPETEVDFITVFLGTNDWGNIGSNNKALGVFGDSTDSTISGCINLFIQDLNNRFPNTLIFFFTPLPRFDAWGENSVNNSQGYKLNELSEMIKRYAHHYSLPVLDLYNESNFKCQTTVQRDMWTVGGDGVHPTHLAHERLLPIMEGFLTKNL